MLDIRQLRAVNAVAHHGSMASAARALGWSHPTLAHHIDTLEGYLGTTVVQRKARGSELTKVGQALYSYTGRILELLALAEQAARTADLANTRLIVGTFSTASACLLPPAIPPLNALGISIDVVQSDDAETISRGLQQGTTDAAVLYASPYETPRGIELMREPLSVLMPANHPLARQKSIRLEDLADEGWVMSKSPGDPCDDILVRAGREAGFRPRCVLRTDDYTVMQGYVAVGMGVSLVPAMALIFSIPHVVAVPVAGEANERIIRFEVAPHAKGEAPLIALAEALRRSARDLSRQFDSLVPSQSAAASTKK